jgi:hypothetical protein
MTALHRLLRAEAACFSRLPWRIAAFAWLVLLVVWGWHHAQEPSRRIALRYTKAPPGAVFPEVLGPDEWDSWDRRETALRYTVIGFPVVVGLTAAFVALFRVPRDT